MDQEQESQYLILEIFKQQFRVDRFVSFSGQGHSLHHFPALCIAHQSESSKSARGGERTNQSPASGTDQQSSEEHDIQ